MFEIVAGELRAKLGVDSAAMCARAGHEACEAKAGPDCGEESLAGFRANAPHISDTAPPVWRAPEGPAGPGRAIHSDLAPLVWRAPEGPVGLAAAAVGGGGAWPGFETTRRAQLAARTASGRAAAHGRTKQPGPTAGSDGARNTSGATDTTTNTTKRAGTPRFRPALDAQRRSAARYNCRQRATRVSSARPPCRPCRSSRR